MFKVSKIYHFEFQGSRMSQKAETEFTNVWEVRRSAAEECCSVPVRYLIMAAQQSSDFFVALFFCLIDEPVHIFTSLTLYTRLVPVAK